MNALPSLGYRSQQIVTCRNWVYSRRDEKQPTQAVHRQLFLDFALTEIEKAKIPQ
jgi:hypothetical protein